MSTAATAVNTQHEPTMVRMTVTPNQAANWLEHANNHNRKLSDRLVQQYARDMRSGRWRLTHQGIAFDTRGNLIDGQHRLWAVVEANVAVEMPVWFNVHAENLMVVDVGRLRRLHDNLRLAGGMGDCTTKSLACLRAMIGHGACPTLTPDEARSSLKRHGGAVAFAMEHLPHIGQKGVTTAEVRAVVARAWYSADHGKLARFCEVLCTSMAKDAPERTIILLRTILCASRGLCSVPTRVERYGRTARALLAFLKGEPPLSRLYVPGFELFPLPEEEKAGK